VRITVAELPNDIVGALATLNRPDIDDDPAVATLTEKHDAVDLIVRRYQSAAAPMRKALRSAVQDQFFKLLEYAHWFAISAVRNNDPDEIVRGLAAIALENFGSDPRDSLVLLSLLAHSAAKLKMNVEAAFQTAADLATGKAATGIRGFLNRPLRDRSIKEMGYKEGKNQFGFTYVELN